MLRPLTAAALLAACLALAQSDGGLTPGAVRVPEGKEVWKDGTPPFPPTVKVALLEGDPKGTGQFTVRVKFPANFTLPPHTHPVDERSTVLSGAVWVGTSKNPDKAQGIKLEAGSFYLNPKGLVHWVITDQETVLQISTNGPWGVEKVK